MGVGYRQCVRTQGLKAAFVVALAVAGAGAFMLSTGIQATRRPAPAPSSTPAVTPLTSCELAVIRNVPVPPPADMTFTAVASTGAAGGGYEFTGTVDVRSARFRWTCDVELRSAGWSVWSVAVTPGAVSPAA